MRGAVHMQITTIGLDIAKNVFQVHGIDAAEKVVVRKQLRRSQVLAFFKALPPCLIGMEACATAHYWARELTKLGPRVRLMPAKDVKAYVKRNKNDAADAEAICEAIRRPTMRFVRLKSAQQQGQLMQHRTRDLLMRQRTQSINALRAHLAELGIVAAQGDKGVKELLSIVADEKDARMPSCGAPTRILRNISGSRNSLRGGPSRSWRWHLPTRWLAWPGRCWPMAAPIGRLCLRQRRKEFWRWKDEVLFVRS